VVTQVVLIVVIGGHITRILKFFGKILVTEHEEEMFSTSSMHFLMGTTIIQMILENTLYGSVPMLEDGMLDTLQIWANVI